MQMNRLALLPALLSLPIALLVGRGVATAATPPSVAKASIEVEKVGASSTWVAASTVFEGTPARAVVTLANLATPMTATVSVVRGDGVVLGSEGVSLRPGTATVTVPIVTDGMAWSDAGVAAAANLAVSIAYSDGTTATAPLAASLSPRPIVMLHGLWSNADTWKAYEGFVQSRHPGWHAYAVGDGKYAGRMDTGALLSPLRRPNTINQNAAEAWTYVAALRNDLNANEIDIVGHSMGGITTRRLLHAQGEAAQSAIRSVVMLGTPNGGSSCAKTWSVPATFELLPDYMRVFNDANPGYPGVDSTLVYAEHLAPTCLDFSLGDSVVPRWSAKAVDVDRLFVGEPTLHSSMTANRSLFDRFVVPALALPASVEPPQGNASGDGSGRAPDEEQAAQVAKTGSADAGQRIDIPVVVAAGEELRVSVVTGPGADLVLESPSGREIPLKQQAVGLPVYTAELPRATQRGTARLRGSSPQRMDWTFSVEGSDLVMDATVDESGDRLTVKADLDDPDADGVRSVQAKIVDQSGDDRTTLRLKDDGTGTDRRSDDEEFAGSGRVATEDGEQVLVEVRATFDDGRQRVVVLGMTDEE